MMSVKSISLRLPGKGTFSADHAMPDGREHTRDRISCPHVIPVFGGEVIEGQQRVAVFDQALDGTGALEICFHGSEMISQSVDMVGYSALNFADSACSVSPVPAGHTLRNRLLC
jgi:hypothetical protein